MFYPLRRKRSALKTCLHICITISAAFLLISVCNSYQSIVYFIDRWKCAVFLTVKRGGWSALSSIKSCAANMPIQNFEKPSQDHQRSAFNLSRMTYQPFGTDSNKFVTIYDCMCDERFINQTSSTKSEPYSPHNQQLSLIFQVSINGYVGEADDSWSLIGRKWSCAYQFNQSNHSNLPQRAPIGYVGGRKYLCPYLNTLSYSIGVIICYLDPEIKVCPSYASLLTGNSYELVQNSVQVTRQVKRPRANVALCTNAPLAIPKSDFLSWHKFVEFIEYQLMSGIEVVIMPKPWNLTSYPIPQDLQSAIDFYVDRGSLRLLDLPYYVEGHSGIPKNAKDVYLMMAAVKVWHLTHCYLRHSLEFNYIAVMDLDEVVGFDMERYPQGINDLMNELEEYYSSSNSAKAFQLTDRRMLTTGCQSKFRNISTDRIDRVTRTFNTSWNQWSIMTRYAAMKKPGHMGKAIIHSDACLLIFHHGCSRFVPQHPSEFFNMEELSGLQNEKFYRKIDAERFGVYLYHYRNCKSKSQCRCDPDGGIADHYFPRNEKLLIDRVYKTASQLFGR